MGLEYAHTLWLWVFVAATATLYYVAGRGKERVENVLDGFTGWLMSDGWGSYRHYPRRLRCWAHLIRKARGLVAERRPRGPRLRPVGCLTPWKP
ncbi:MAG: transposase [Comamonadaceae bacterium]|nr:transposase [Comamonadaceae bacterium]